MTRIYEALRKAQTSRSRSAEAPAAVAPVLPSAVQAVPRPASALAQQPSHVSVPDTVPFHGTPELNEHVIHEMTSLRMNVEAALTERIPRVVMLMSALPGEGTTTVATQFAATLARDERLRILLVDLNARRPVLSDMRSETAGDERLTLLPLGSLASGGMVSAAVARDQIDAISGGYDWVVLDGPPALESPDAGPLAAISDGVVMVIQAGRTKEPVLGRAVDLLRKAGSNMLGSVLNRRRLEIPDFIYRRI